MKLIDLLVDIFDVWPEDAEKAIQDMVLRQGFKREDYHIISFNVPKIRGK